MKTLVLILSLLAAPAFADSIQITGTAVTGDIDSNFQIMGATFSAYGAGDGPTFSGVCQNVCSVVSFVAAPGPNSLNGVTAQGGGTLQFSNSAFTLSDFQNGTFSQPVTFFGEVQAFDPNTNAPLWTVQLRGTGTANYSLFLSGPYIFTTYWTFDGTATVVPEPSTLLMIGTGLGLPLLTAPKRLARLLWRV